MQQKELNINILIKSYWDVSLTKFNEGKFSILVEEINRTVLWLLIGK